MKIRCRLLGHKFHYWYPIDSLLNWGKTPTFYCVRCGVEWIDTSCDCSVHDITTPGAAHADDCPRYD